MGAGVASPASRGLTVGADRAAANHLELEEPLAPCFAALSCRLPPQQAGRNLAAGFHPAPTLSAMTELVFSIQAIFDAQGPAGCLAQYQSTCYHIPAYQRGYKWGSEPNGAVSILLQDLWQAFEAYQRQEKKEYYLQYITVKKGQLLGAGRPENCLEVIDGQQRLTTLSIIVSVLAALLEVPNRSAGKLHYAIRENLFATHIYHRTDLTAFVGQEWAAVAAEPAMNKQDIYYLHAAACNTHAFFAARQAQLPAFAEYFLQHVKLIVNSVEVHVPSETVFKNLNSNKVLLTETELIKALVITKVGRAGAKTERKGFKEVLEARLNLGRLWDELSRWANQAEISMFYFNGSADGMYQLLLLAARCLQTDQPPLAGSRLDPDLRLFNFYNHYPDIGRVYTTIKDVQAALADWYAAPDTYNLLGYCRFVKGSKLNRLSFLESCLACPTKPALQRFLGETKARLLPQQDVGTLRYGEPGHDVLLHAVLLALSVFGQGVNGAVIRFNFHAFVTEKWSLEHIFPQSPEGKDAVLSGEQKAAVRDMIGAGLDDELRQILDLDQRTDEQKQRYYRALQNESHLNAIGNLCLLTSAGNSSNGCLFFKEKRGNVLRLLQQGSFVPKHTFDVFSKMIKQLVNHDPNTWTVADMEQHQAYVTSSLTN